MTISISLSPTAEARLREKAAAIGQPLDVYASGVLERAAVAQSADQLLEPFRRQVEASGMSDLELDAFFEDIREKAFRDRQGRNG